MTSLLKTPMHDWHAAHDGRMVDFTGWSMPVQYSSIIDEHNATRNAAGLFDVSHMARFRFDGDQAGPFLDSIVTRRVENLKAGQIRYAMVTKEDGGILDDILVYRLADAQGQLYYWVVVNAGNREKIASWIRERLPESGVTFTDLTLETAMIAVQGPKAIELAQPLVDVTLSEMKYYSGCETQILGQQSWVSRTGYTGEDGCEITVPAEIAVEVWRTLADGLAAIGGLPCGLGCRDTLRLEAAMPLYGHELSEQINPIQADLKFAVSMDHEFIGKAAISASIEDGKQMKRVGLQMQGRRAAREHYTIHLGDQQVGEVTSGSFSPTLDINIAMGYVQPELAEPGTELEIDIRGKRHLATVVALPFYSRKRKT